MTKRISHPLPPDLKEEAVKTLLEQLPYIGPEVKEFGRDGSEIFVVLDSSARDAASIEATLAKLVGQLQRSYAKMRRDIIFEHKPALPPGTDPMPYLRRSGQALETGPGRFTVQGELWRIMRGLDRFFHVYALSLGAVEQHHPTTVPVASMIETGYLGAFPQHALLVSTFHNEIDNLAAVATAPAESFSRLAPPGQMLAPTVCCNCFEALRGQTLLEEALFTALGYCHRDEGPNTGGLLRLQTFLMREIIFFGGEEAVENKRKAIIAHLQSAFVDWGVSFSVVSASDPFFAGAAESKRVFQSLQGLKHELRMDLPYDGATVACASFNNHKDTLTKAYRIADAAGPKFSGCVGYGHERMAFALMAQFGVHPERWPARLRNDVLAGPG